MNTIVLIGFMGAGKTTVGRMLQKMTGYDLVDTDDYIEELNGMTIRDIFSQKGEVWFRDEETRALGRLLNEGKDRIISCGGGLVLREENRRLLKELGIVIYLRVSADTVLERLKGDTSRPLLQGGDAAERVNHLLQERSSIYELAADRIISVDHRTTEDICSEILNR